MLTKFLSNKWNLFGLQASSYFIIGYLMQTMGITMEQMVLVYLLIGVGNFASYLYGMSYGIVLTTSKRPNFIQELDKINEMIREENNTTSNKKRKPSKKKKGCGSGGCKNC
tara:strand:+ start:1225 stop:1557 length:333 start_codon:yes stop_codon:yes gene_type:complete